MPCAYKDQIQRVLDLGRIRCIGCGQCLAGCPGSKPKPSMNRFDWSDPKRGAKGRDVAEFLSECTACGYCDQLCPSGCHPSRLFAATSAHLPKPDGYSAFTKSRGHGKVRIPRNRDKALPGNLINRKRFAPADTLLFLGCHTLSANSVGGGIYSIAEKIEPSMEVVAGNRLCCGNRQLLAGDFEAAKKAAGMLDRLLLDVAPKKIITPCGDCFAALESALDRLDKNAQVMPFAQWVLENQSAFDWEKPVGEIAYLTSMRFHCAGKEHFTGRLLGKMYEVSTLIEGQAGQVTAGATVFGKLPQYLGACCRTVIDEAVESGAETLTVDCVHLVDLLAGAASNRQFKVRHIASLLSGRASLAEKREGGQ